MLLYPEDISGSILKDHSIYPAGSHRPESAGDFVSPYGIAEGIAICFFEYPPESRVRVSRPEGKDCLEFLYVESGEILLQYYFSHVLLTGGMMGVYGGEGYPDKVFLRKGRGIIKGISIVLNIPAARDIITRYLPQNASDICGLQKMIERRRDFFSAFFNEDIRRVFSSIAADSFAVDREYLLLKVMELLFVSVKCIRKRNDRGGDRDKNLQRRKVFEEVVDCMRNNLERNITIDEIAGDVGLTGRQLNTIFQTFAQKNSYAFLKSLRLQEAKRLLLQTGDSITEIAGQMGWQNPSKFSASFRKEFGYAPEQYRRRIASE